KASQIQEAFVDFVSFVVKKTIRFVSSFLVITPNLGVARSSEVAINNLSCFWVKVNETTRLSVIAQERRLVRISNLGKIRMLNILFMNQIG
ncbi:MAG: hypothetical protein CMI15_12560, partial [Opitutaceae bacterium]|nr:hypothetical protein [Opitutaceae bacterium]